MLVIYHLYCFTDQVTDPYTRNIMGWSLIFFMAFNMLYRVTQAFILVVNEIKAKILVCIQYCKMRHKLNKEIKELMARPREMDEVIVIKTYE